MLERRPHAVRKKILESTSKRYRMEGIVTSIVQDTILERPSIDRPHPACDRAIHYCCPDETENHCRQDTSTFSNRTHDDSNSDGGELHLSSAELSATSWFLLQFYAECARLLEHT